VNIPNPFNGDVSDEQIKAWLDQFEAVERPLIIPPSVSLQVLLDQARIRPVGDTAQASC
jgi:hypothetical protein